MMRVLLTAASALFTLAAPLPALTAAWRAVNGRHPERGVFRPQVLTWSTWAALAIIAGSASRLSAQVFAYACAAAAPTTTGIDEESPPSPPAERGGSAT